MRNDVPPTLLLLEDDPPSRHFLHEVLAALPIKVDSVETLAQARAAIARNRYDLWLFDAHLPDGHSATLLEEMYVTPGQPPAIALTADPQMSQRQSLLAAGFVEVAIKPISAANLRQLVQAKLPPPLSTAAENPDWNEAHALAAAGGVERTRDALRQLFLAELPGLRQRIDAALQADDRHQLTELLHRLQGSCALVGADALLQSLRALARDPQNAAYQRDLQRAYDRVST